MERRGTYKPETYDPDTYKPVPFKKRLPAAALAAVGMIPLAIFGRDAESILVCSVIFFICGLPIAKIHIPDIEDRRKFLLHGDHEINIGGWVIKPKGHPPKKFRK